MNSLIDRMSAHGRAWSIEALKALQPTINLEHALQPQFEIMVNYVKETFAAVDFLHRSQPAKLDGHYFQVIFSSLLGVVTIGIFIGAVATLLSLPTKGLTLLPGAAITLILACAGAWLTIKLFRDCDACIRYDAIVAGFHL